MYIYIPLEVLQLLLFPKELLSIPIKCRLVALRLSDEIVNEHRRKAKKKDKSQGKQLTAKEIELLAFNIIITNANEDMPSSEAVCDLYRARWQIELVFKACKSYLNIDKLGNCGLYQLECLIYGRLTAI
ncbi:Transposase DDE domain-containing protein [Anaerovirgula multivorans]|uniref:Transposase DDE domain-containing protein n=1 Tax=Anaerovirgula multivorans TaxID=312168 RepID=A0A239GGF3_9FIRM|nr:Transposase DDE domain-containing protein [Anaerovirgula multivorans]